MKRTSFIALISLMTINLAAPMTPNNSSNSVTKYIVPACKIAAGLGGLAISAYSFSSLYKSTDTIAKAQLEEFKAYLAPYPTRTTQTVAEGMFKTLAVTYLTNNLLLLPFTAAASTYFLISGVKDAMQIYKQPKN